METYGQTNGIQGATTGAATIAARANSQKDEMEAKRQAILAKGGISPSAIRDQSAATEPTQTSTLTPTDQRPRVYYAGTPDTEYQEYANSTNSAEWPIKNLICGFVGIFMLCVGVFMPLITVTDPGDSSDSGSLSYFNGGQGDGRYLLILAGVAFIFLRNKKFSRVRIMGVLSLVLLAFTAFSLISKFSSLQRQFPYSGVSINFDFAWLVMLVGGILLIVTPAFKEH